MHRDLQVHPYWIPPFGPPKTIPSRGVACPVQRGTPLGCPLSPRPSNGDGGGAPDNGSPRPSHLSGHVLGLSLAACGEVPNVNSSSSERGGSDGIGPLSNAWD